MARRSAPVALLAVALASCTNAPTFAAFMAYDDAHMSTGTGSSSGSDTDNTTVPNSTAAETDSDPGTSAATGIEGASDGEDSSTAGEAGLTPPRILAVDVPASVHLAGPVTVKVTAEHATAVQGTLDGVELDLFEDQGGGVWLGHAPIFGAVDNGDHVVEVTATNGPLAATWPPVLFTVSTPAPGGQAWAVLAPPASTTRRAAVTAEGDLIEVGTAEIEGVMKPTIRKRSAANGSELWPEGTIVLDEREGSADAVALRADGWIWVAMNVANPNKKWQPRIVLLDAEGHATGVEAPTEPGPTVRGIAATDDDGFFAVGFGGSGFGDMDVVYWRMTGEDVATASAKQWDHYPPEDESKKHKFDDLAFDVVVVDDVAWVVGASTGDHDLLPNSKPVTRGLVVRMDVNTGVTLGPVALAEPGNVWRHSMFLAAGQHPDGVVAIGNESTDDGTTQRITVQAFDDSNARIYYSSGWTAPVAYGTGVAWTAHGAVLAAGVVHDGDGLRGVLYGRGVPGLNFDHWLPGTEPSAANGLALDAYEQVFLVGDRTIGGVRQARASRIQR
ncbi:hypothetical protein OV203_05450 [Nannocystis sp. ILAH1]|uniref:hypothetical protein n=1 Tax=Nannocystis sp. ILAH1 TaxID=2996789 RepID=UPI0022720F9B|nr:hypothetical protein [Nannocystis sp. ILAH1]MCY0986553.1 hypothetical protein [Nannocystis sp. ILAH1]